MIDEKTRQTLGFQDILEELARQASSRLGSDFIRALEPATELDIIERRARPVREALALLFQNQQIPLGGIEDLRDLVEIATLPGGVLDLEHWPRLRRHLDIVDRLLHFGGTVKEKAPALAALVASLSGEPGLAVMIDRTIDRDGIMRDDASPRLHEIRRHLQREEQGLLRLVQRLLGQHASRGHLQESFATLRGNRHVLPVKAGMRGRVAGILHGSSASGETVYIEPAEVVEASNELESLREQERAEVHHILRELTAQLLPLLPGITQNLETLARLDAVRALSRVAHEKGWSFPLGVKKGALRLLKAHHPLIHLRRAAASVPIAVSLEADDHCVVLSGPNAGGKTTAMKTVALCCMLHQCGAPIPAWPDSSLPVFESFHADIGDLQDVSEGLSTFSGHVRRLREILGLARERAMILLDELGTGTDPREGGALAVAILESLLPKATLTLATSHLNQVKIWADETAGVRNASFSLDPVTHQPTYSLRLDLPGASEALHIAQNEGMPARVLERAQSLLTDEERSLAVILQRSGEREKTLSANLREAEARAKSLEEQERTARRRSEALRLETKALREKSLAEREAVLREMRERMDRMLSEIAAQEDPQFRKALLLDARKDAWQEQNAIGQERQRSTTRGHARLEPQKMKPGTRVFTTEVGRWGELLEVDTARGKARVRLGNIEMRVSLESLLDHDPGAEDRAALLAAREELRLNTPGKPRKSRRIKAALERLDLPDEIRSEPRPEVTTGYVTFQRPATARMEIDLHGMRVDEALSTLDHSLDQALLADLPFLRVLHGTGTGKLYRAVHEHLRGHRAVKKFRFANSDEGGGGVTIVEF